MEKARLIAISNSDSDEGQCELAFCKQCQNKTFHSLHLVLNEFAPAVIRFPERVLYIDDLSKHRQISIVHIGTANSDW